MTPSALTARIANEIAALIESGDLTAGEHLTTQALADRFEVSRSPVREALDLLTVRKIVEKLPNRGFFVGSNVRRNRKPRPSQAIDLPDPYYQLAEDWIRDAVPGEVTEQWLRQRYDLTKAQLTDLLNRAVQEGWIEPKQGYGWRLLYVVKTPEALEQLYRLRSVLEPAGFLEPTFSLDNTLIRKQRRIQEGLIAGEIERLPPERLLRAGTDFHEDLALCSGNAFFHQALIRANRMRRLLEYRGTLDRTRLHSQCVEHLKILNLLERGENIQAAALMRQHLSGALTKKSPVYSRLFRSKPLRPKK